MTSRRDFLNAGALAALAPTLAAAPTASPSPAPSPSPTLPPLNFDLAAFDAATSKPATTRHMFAATKLDGGGVLDVVKTVVETYVSTGSQASSVAAAAVLYHGLSIMLAFDDSIWRDVAAHAGALPDFLKPDFADYKTAKSNPFVKAKSADDASFEGLVANGTLFFVCNRATEGFAHFIARQTKTAPLAAYERMKRGLLPGATLVPAGIWAIHALQDRHYTYQQVTL